MATVLEVGAYYVPWLDDFLDTVATLVGSLALSGLALPAPLLAGAVVVVVLVVLARRLIGLLRERPRPRPAPGSPSRQRDYEQSNRFRRADMVTKTDFTAEEWNVVRRAPFMAGLVMVAASPSGPFGIVKEMFAVGKLLADVKSHGASSDLAKAIVADLETAEGQQSMPAELQGKPPDQVRGAALEACRQAAALVEKRATPDEARAFKQWLVSIGHTVAEAAKEGGFLGFGGVRVSEQETSALKDLTPALGLKA